MPMKVWFENDQGDTYRQIEDITYTFMGGKATKKEKNELMAYLRKETDELPPMWEVSGVPADTLEETPVPRRGPRPIVRICSPIIVPKDTRTRMRRSDRQSTH